MRLKLKKQQRQCNVFIVCLLFFISISSAFAKGDVSKHQQIMAGLLLHLTSFTQWPEQSSESINLCILGDDLFENYINDIAKRRSKSRSGKAIVISRSKNITKASVDSCQMIYIAPKQLSQLWDVLPEEHNILLVSYSKNFIAQGGMINFVTDNKRVKLEVNLPAVLNAKLKLSSTLLKHAKIISGGSQPLSSEEKKNEGK